MSKLELTDLSPEMLPTPCRKKWYKSKTLWTNIVIVLTGVEQLLPTVGLAIAPMIMPYVLLAAGVANIILRLVTTEGIE